ncbi:MAG: sensor histidine kinase [Oscillatoriales cyanobacterium RM1_1_9]|nr:sensor histidine kinase [Oscillatoriales cyanobacterium RM2_1_1]NJO71059.1 sensor histidine kinase [Oscillatoriales cyanobacterium RM1_1_9]
MPVSWESLGQVVADLFERYPQLPGVVLLDQDPGQGGQLVGVLSRQRFLESLINSQGVELILTAPIRVLYGYGRVPLLTLPGQTPILVAAQQAFRRSPEFLGEPILVTLSGESAPQPILNPADKPIRKTRRRTSAAGTGKHLDQNPETMHCLLNIQDLNLAYWQIRGIETQVRYERLQAQMIQTQRMASLGRLVDGVAHEILDPVGFIWGNLSHLDSYHTQIMQLLSAYESCLGEEPEEIQQLKEDIEFEFIQADISQMIASIKGGAERLKQLAASLQTFCHIDEVHPKPVDLHSCLDGILLLLKSYLSSDIRIIKNYGHLPPVPCYLGQLSQVFMNILTTLVNSLLDRAASRDWAQDHNKALAPEQLQIQITTQVCGDETEIKSLYSNQRWVSIQIADNGPGMRPEHQQRILESFSTQRPLEKETSLSLSYYIITAKHGGQLKLQSQLGVGTEFQILLPMV